jgi:hypothetical protein
MAGGFVRQDVECDMRVIDAALTMQACLVSKLSSSAHCTHVLCSKKIRAWQFGQIRGFMP